MSSYLPSIKLDSLLEGALKHKVTLLAATSALLYGAYFLNRPRNLPPGPLGYPYIGSVKEITGNISKDFMRLGEKYGDICCLWMGGDMYVVILNSYDVLREAKITHGSDFSDRIPGHTMGNFNVVEPLFNGIYDDGHKAMRKLTIQTFRKFVTTKMDGVLSGEMKKFDAVVTSAKGKAIEIDQSIKCILSNMFCALHFDKTYPHDHPDLLTVLNGTEDWYNAFDDAFKDCFTGHRPKCLNAKQFLHKYDAFMRRNIEEHKETLDPKHTRDMTDSLLKEGALERFGIDTLSNMMMELLPNGVVTAGIAFQWMLYYLFVNPEYQGKILEEIRNLKGSSAVEAADRGKLPLADAFVMETLRLSTPLQLSIPAKPMAALVDSTLHGYHIPKNALMVANLAGIHLDPKIFPEPHVFRPERFIHNGVIDTREGFIPFGLGRRNCVAEYLMRSSLFYIFANILQQYEVSSDCKEMSREVSNNLMLKGERINIRFKKR